MNQRLEGNTSVVSVGPDKTPRSLCSKFFSDIRFSIAAGWIDLRNGLNWVGVGEKICAFSELQNMHTTAYKVVFA